MLLWSNLAFLIVSSAIFGFGLGAFGLMRWPPRKPNDDRVLIISSLLFALSVILLLPALSGFPRGFQ